LRTNGAIDGRFLYLWLLTDFITERVEAIQRGASYPAIRDSDVKKLPVPIPSLVEQRRIAGVLTAVQRAVDQQERLIAVTAELKKALMQKLFTQGTCGEPQKQTEIGPIPKSWRVERIDRMKESFTYGTSVKCEYGVDGAPVLRIPNVVGGHIETSDLKFGNPKKNELGALALRPGDLLFVRTNGVQENAGRCSMYRGELGKDCYFASYLIRVRVNTDVLCPNTWKNTREHPAVGPSFLAGPPGPLTGSSTSTRAR
jgi:type I restriction enzyme S subunit